MSTGYDSMTAHEIVGESNLSESKKYYGDFIETILTGSTIFWRPVHVSLSKFYLDFVTIA